MKPQRGLWRFLARYPLATFIATIGTLLTALGFAQQGYELWRSGVEAWHLQAAGAGFIVLWLGMMLYNWEQAQITRSEAQPIPASAPAQAAPAHAVSSHNQSGGITAHTVNQAPKPQVKWGALTVAVNMDGTNMISGRFEVVAPYPPAALHLRAISPGIETFKVSPVGRIGIFLEGHSGKRDGWCFTTLHHPMGTYQATVVTASDQLKFKHNFE